MLYWSLANKKLIYQNTLLLITSYFIKVHDIGKIKSNNKIINNSFNPSSEVSFKSKLIALISKSELIYLVKDMLHQLYMWWVNNPAPFTRLYKVMLTPLDYDLLEPSNFLTAHNKKKGFVILFINYPYNFKYDIKQLSQSSLYNSFNSHNLTNLKIFQSPLITNKKENLNWRNIYPNSASIKEVFNFIQQEILKKNENTNSSAAKTKTSPAQ